MRAFPLLCAFTFLGSAACLAAPARTTSTTPKTIEFLPEKDGLKVSISADSRSISLRSTDPHIDVVLQNTSAQPIVIYTQGNSWGYDNVTLKIIAVDGKISDTPLILSKNPRGWFGNAPSTELIEPGDALVREVRLQIPAHVFDPKAPFAESDLSPRIPLYMNFPAPAKNAVRRVTISAVFANDDTTSNRPLEKVWTGHIASSPIDYSVYWDDQN